MIFSILLFSFLDLITGRALYIDAVNGINSGNCSLLTTPCRSIDYAMLNASLTDGDSLQLIGNGPFYARGIGVTANDITITSTTTTTTTIMNSSTTDLFPILSCDNNNSTSSANDNNATTMFIINAQRFTLNNLSFEGCKNVSAVYAPNCSSLNIHNCAFRSFNSVLNDAENRRGVVVVDAANNTALSVAITSTTFSYNLYCGANQVTSDDNPFHANLFRLTTTNVTVSVQVNMTDVSVHNNFAGCGSSMFAFVTTSKQVQLTFDRLNFTENSSTSGNAGMLFDVFEVEDSSFLSIKNSSFISLTSSGTAAASAMSIFSEGALDVEFRGVVVSGGKFYGVIVGRNTAVLISEFGERAGDDDDKDISPRNVTISDCEFLGGNWAESIGLVFAVDDGGRSNSSVLIERSLFNGFGGIRSSEEHVGGALAVFERFDDDLLKHKRLAIRVVDSMFEDNAATSGAHAGVYRQSPQTEFSLQFVNCSFVGGIAIGGIDGAIAMVDVSLLSHGRSARPMSLIVRDSTFSGGVGGGISAVASGHDNRNNTILLERTVWRNMTVSSSSSSIFDVRSFNEFYFRDSLIDASTTTHSSVQLLTADVSLAMFSANPIYLSGTRVICAAGSNGTFDADYSVELGTVTYFHMSIVLRCDPCADRSYNLASGSMLFDTQLGTDGIRLSNSSSSLQFRCLSCRPESIDCAGGSVGVVRNYWAYVPPQPNVSTQLVYSRCPNGFCCDESNGCEHSDACAGNRTGVLCGACLAGFSHALSIDARCVELAQCSSLNNAIAMIVVVLFSLAFVVYQLFRTNHQSNGLMKVMVAFINIASLLLSQVHFVSNNNTSSSSSSTLSPVISFIKETFENVSNWLSGVIDPIGNFLVVCGHDGSGGWSSLDRLYANFAQPIALFGVWIIVVLFYLLFVTIRRNRNQRRKINHNVNSDNDDNDDEQLPIVVNDEITPLIETPTTTTISSKDESNAVFQIAASFSAACEFSLFTMLNATTKLLVTTNVANLDNNECRLWQAGDVVCGAWQIVWLVQLLVIVAIPLLFELAKRYGGESRAVTRAFRAIGDAPFGERWRWFGLLVALRRVLFVLLFSFVIDVALRLALARLLLSMALLAQLLAWPYADRTINRLEFVLLGVLLLAASLQSPPSPFDAQSVVSALAVTQLCCIGIGLASIVVVFAAQRGWFKRLFSRIHRRSQTL